MPDQTEALDLGPIRRRAEAFKSAPPGTMWFARAIPNAEDVPGLVSEVERLRARLAPASRFTICAVPASVPQHYLWEVAVERRGEGRWAVLWSGFALGVDLEWDYEPVVSERDVGWLSTHRFGLETALLMAEQVAPDLEVNGLTAAQAAERAKERGKGHA